MSPDGKSPSRLSPCKKLKEGTEGFVHSQISKRKSYFAVAAGAFHTAVLRNDGTAFVVGSPEVNLVPPLPIGCRYIAVAACLEHTLFLRSDGQGVAMCGDGNVSECGRLPLLQNNSYVSADTGGHHCLLLRSDGEVIAFGHNGDGRCNVPVCPSGMWYTAVAAGLRHSLLIRSDGSAIAFGCNDLPPGHLQRCGSPCDVPPLPAGLTYGNSNSADDSYFTQIVPKTAWKQSPFGSESHEHKDMKISNSGGTGHQTCSSIFDTWLQ